MCEADCQALDTWRPKDTRLDSVTFEAYLTSRGANEAALATATVWTRAMLGQDPKDISALFFLNYCKSGGGLLQMRSDRKHGAQYLRVRQGTQAFSLGLASSLPEGTDYPALFNQLSNMPTGPLRSKREVLPMPAVRS